MSITLNLHKVYSFLSEQEVHYFEPELMGYHRNLLAGKGAGSEFLGWLHLPSSIRDPEIKRLEDKAARISAQSENVVVIGIGGSYLGARAVIDALKNQFEKAEKGKPHIHYAGHNLCGDYMHDLLKHLEEIDHSLVVISKSGTTTEPAIAFRYLRQLIEAKYGKDEAAKRILTVTDARKGALKQLSDKEGYSSFVIPDNVGGRYSVFTPVGLLPIAIAGYDIRKIIAGARDMEGLILQYNSIEKNPAYAYVAARNALYRRGKPIEVMVSYKPALTYFAEWWKQLFGESEGKQEKGIFPASVQFTTDLHSLGQYLQDGLRIMFETVLRVENDKNILSIPQDESNLDALNYLSEKKLHEVNATACNGTIMAHIDGGVPVIELGVPGIDEYTIGQLIYFFEFSCALSGYTLGVNPFDQPGVETYKRNMFALLGKAGFEDEKALLLKRLKAVE